MSAHEAFTVYDSVGDVGIRRLVAEFYSTIPGDEILGPMYPPHDLAAAERRLADFLIFRFGGPDTYLRERGHPQLRMRHIQFAITSAARDRWVELMDAALEKAAFPPAALTAVKRFLHEAATFLINRE